ncbi:hypothetical protein MF672_013500 [Actinomadura sp. ATCC 31491]|uniref:DUF998 domain-containing protein n=1 Tax=Actinomadura luzonensis TaxID=2805427 RepID=A0ABT0FS32_9ACTN|nr:hypothetical protein [Actinomadura luzonensis]MCK2214800.1 hypothetical protein [Actinomadura luzonensis]
MAPRPPALDRDRRIWDLLCAGVAAGALAWGAVGAWTAATVRNYPWNAWIPFADGTAKGVVLGLLATTAALAVLPPANLSATRRWAVLAGAFVGGSLLGTARDLNGPPDPVLYFAEPLPDERWYGTTMLLHWAGKVAAPAACCAVVLTLLAARPYRPRQSFAASLALLLAGVALLLLPVIAGALAPEVQGNGRHVNEGPLAGLRCWAVGVPVLLAGLIRTGALLTATHSRAVHQVTGSDSTP